MAGLVRDAEGQYAALPLTERVARLHIPEPNSGCWLWIGTIERFGHGRIEQDGKSYMAHRVVYELERGTIPGGLPLDHRCRNPHCVNPWHLEAVPQRVNVLRGEGIAAKRAAQTHCVSGHEFTLDNTYLLRGRYRFCRACGNRRNREHRARLAANR